VHSAWAFSSAEQQQQRAQEVQQSTQRLRMLMDSAHPNEGNPGGRSGSGIGIGMVVGSGGRMIAADVLALQQSRYGLGDRRSLDQAIQFSGIDTRNRKLMGNYCGNLDYVPFEQHPWGADYIPKFDEATEAFADVRDPGSIYYDRSNRDMVQAWEAAAQAQAQVRLQHPVQEEALAAAAPIVPLAAPLLPQEKSEPSGASNEPSTIIDGSHSNSNANNGLHFINNTLQPVHFISQLGPKPVLSNAFLSQQPANSGYLYTNKLLVNVVCLAGIFVLIFIRICVNQRNTIRRTVNNFTSGKSEDNV
jgi:hypothetical protein